MVVSSSIEQYLCQRDGRHIVREDHLIDDGTHRYFDYICDDQIDVQAKLSQRAADINNGLL